MKRIRSKIGKLLIEDGYISDKDLEKAFEIQKKDSETANIPLGKTLVRRGLITKKQLQTLLEHPEIRKNIGTLALEKGYVDEKCLSECLRKKAPDEPVGQVLVKEGLIADKELNELLSAQLETTRLGELAVELGMIREKDLQKLLSARKPIRTIGEILCDMQLITPDDLTRIHLRMFSKKLRLGEILRKQKLIDDSKLEQALSEQNNKSETLGKILLEKEFVTEEQLYTALSLQVNIPFKKLDHFKFDNRQKYPLRCIISPQYAQKHSVLPLSLEGNFLTLAISTPEKHIIVEELREVYQHLKISCVLIMEDTFNQLFNTLYDLKNENTDTSDDKTDQIPADQTDITNYILDYAIRNKAVDIHLEHNNLGGGIRYRINGILQSMQSEELKRVPQIWIKEILSDLKTRSGLVINEKQLPQHGTFRYRHMDNSSGQKVDMDLGVTTCPALIGETMTVQLLNAHSDTTLLNITHISETVLTQFRKLLKTSSGLILIAGPGGSDKKKILYDILKQMYRPEVKIITAEETIQQSIPGIIQTQTRTDLGLSFAQRLPYFQSMVPDILMVDALNSSETARAALDAARNGLLVISSIPADDAAGAIIRLRRYNIDDTRIASCLKGVLAQRKIRKNCDLCRKKYTPEKNEWQLLLAEKTEQFSFFKGHGCEACGFTGYHNHLMLSELMVINREIIQALNHGAGEHEIRRIAMKAGMKTLLEDGLMKLGQTTLRELAGSLPARMNHTACLDIKNMSPQAQSEPLRDESANDAFFNAGFKKVISDPQSQRIVITQLYQHYVSLIRQTDAAAAIPDAADFEDFIESSCHRIRTRFECSSVSFFIDTMNGAVQIFASSAGMKGNSAWQE